MQQININTNLTHITKGRFGRFYDDQPESGLGLFLLMWGPHWANNVIMMTMIVNSDNAVSHK